MNAVQAKTALTKAVKPVHFIVFSEKKGDALELEIGSATRGKANQVAVLEGRGVCRLADPDTALFSVKKATPVAKTLILKICKPSFTNVLFKEGAEADADLNAEAPPDRPQQAAPMQSPTGVQSSAATPRKRTVPLMARRNVADVFTDAVMSKVEKDTDRGIPKGMGDFGKVFGNFRTLGKIEQKIRGGQNGGALDNTARANLTQAYDSVLGAITKYTTDRPGTPTDAVQQIKQGFCKRAERGVGVARSQVKYADKFDRLTSLARKNVDAGLTDAEVAELDQNRAELLMRAMEHKEDEKPSGGTSDVRLIRDESGKVAYVFKSIDGESDQMGFAKGEGTAHEILTSKLSEILSGYGFETGFPRTSLANLPLSDGAGGRANAAGALVEGLSGQAPVETAETDGVKEVMKLAGINFDAAKLARDLAAQGLKPGQVDNKVRLTRDQTLGRITAEQKQRVKDSLKDRLAKTGYTWDANITPDDMAMGYRNMCIKEADQLAGGLKNSEVNRALLTGMLSASGDIKWSNMMIDGDKARPFDGGANMLSAAQLKKISMDGGVLKPASGLTLLSIPSDGEKPHPAASQPLDPLLTAQILKIDPDVVEAQMTFAVAQVQRADPTLQNVIGTSNVKTCVASIKCVQAAIRSNPPTMTDFVTAYNANLKAWIEGPDFPG